METVSFILDRYGWEAIDELDNWLYIFDGLPKKMKLVVDFNIQNPQYTNEEIGKLTGYTPEAVRKRLERAKKRFLRGENVI